MLHALKQEVLPPIPQFTNHLLIQVCKHGSCSSSSNHEDSGSWMKREHTLDDVLPSGCLLLRGLQEMKVVQVEGKDFLAA